MTDQIGSPEAGFGSAEGGPQRLERRARPRVPLTLSARLDLLSAAGHAFRTVAVQTRNVSGRGAYVISPETLTLGEVVVLAVDLPVHRAGRLPIQIHGKAEVVRLDPPRGAAQGMALRFLRAGIPRQLPARPQLSFGKRRSQDKTVIG